MHRFENAVEIGAKHILIVFQTKLPGPKTKFLLLGNLPVRLQQEIKFVDQDYFSLTWSNKHVWWNNSDRLRSCVAERMEEHMIFLNCCFVPHYEQFIVFKCSSVDDRIRYENRRVDAN